MRGIVRQVSAVLAIIVAVSLRWASPALAVDDMSDAAALSDEIESNAELVESADAQSLPAAAALAEAEDFELPEAEKVASPQAGGGRVTQEIDNNWYFIAGDTGDGGWSFPVGGESGVVNVPHTWSYAHPTLSYIPIANSKTVSYTKKLDISDVKDCRVSIKFEAASKNLTLYVDGEEVGYHTGGYSAFTFDLTESIQKAIQSNKTTITLTAKVQNIDTKTTPINVDFIQWAGLYRDVELIVTPGQYISTENSGSNGLFVGYEINGSDAAVTTRVDVSNQAEEAKDLKIESSILNAEGETVSTQTREISVDAMKTCQEFEVQQSIENVHLWNGTADPYLYTVQVTLYDAEECVLDTQADDFGVRTFEIKDGKCFLNGEVIEIHGVGYHQDREGMGYAVTMDQIEQDVDTMLEMGVNAVRASHYQHDDYFYELCDQKGILVYAEIPFYLIYAKTEAFQASVKGQLTELIRQDYNHPSIIMWGIQNELCNRESFASYGDDFKVTDDELVAFVEGLVDIVHDEDPGRMCVQAIITGSDDPALFARWSGNIDITGLNLYRSSSYTDQGRVKLTEKLNSEVERFKQVFGVDYVMLSEYGAGGAIAQHTELSEDTRTSTSFQPEETQSFIHEVYWPFIQQTDGVALSFVWNMFDFSCYRNEGGLTRINTKGMVCYDHATKKDAFYYYKAVWNDSEKFVHLTSKRFTDRVSDKQQIKAYSNCDRVELYLNDDWVGVGRRTQEGVFVWDDVDISAAESNTLKVVGYCSDGTGDLIKSGEDSMEGLRKSGTSMFRLYNQYTGEHFYTSSQVEVDSLVAVGWSNEGVEWTAPTESDTPVYRLYNPYVEGGDHFYTTSTEEYEYLIAQGWNGEGIAWYSDDDKGMAIYRLYNPYATTGTHHYTSSPDETESLKNLGWQEEGIGWYGKS